MVRALLAACSATLCSLAASTASAQTYQWSPWQWWNYCGTSGHYMHDEASGCLYKLSYSSMFGMAAGCPGGPTSLSLNWIRDGWGYHRNSSRLVATNGHTTHSWNGVSWVVVANHQANPFYFQHVVAHRGRGTVMAFGGPGPNYHLVNDLYEWNGVRWNLIPATVKPPRNWSSAQPELLHTYLTCAYDERRDKIVLSDSVMYDSYSQTQGAMPVVWEWDAAHGWVNVPVQGNAIWPSRMYFDSWRGILVKIQGWSGTMAEWDGGPAWRTVTTNPVRPGYMGDTRVRAHG